MDNPDTLATLDTHDTGRRERKHWTHKTQDKDNPDTLATLDTQDTGRRERKHWTHKRQDEEKQNTKTQHRKVKQ
jgi:hypothetical protein